MVEKEIGGKKYKFRFTLGTLQALKEAKLENVFNELSKSKKKENVNVVDQGIAIGNILFYMIVDREKVDKKEFMNSIDMADLKEYSDLIVDLAGKKANP